MGNLIISTLAVLVLYFVICIYFTKIQEKMKCLLVADEKQIRTSLAISVEIP